jgi:hypothetical protein
MPRQLIIILLVALVLVLMTVQNPNPVSVQFRDYHHTDFTIGGSNYFVSFRFNQAVETKGQNSPSTERNRRVEISTGGFA